MIRKFCARTAAVILFVAATPASFAAEDPFSIREGIQKLASVGSFSLGAGFNYSTGDYGTGADTEIISIPITGRYDTGPWTLKLTVPFMRVEGGAGVVPGVGRVDNTNPIRRGLAGVDLNPPLDLGDVVTSVTYAAYYDKASRFGVDLTGKVKFGTADEDKGLGTGETDYGVAVDIYKSIGAFNIFGGLSYTWLGSSQYIILDDVMGANIGASYRLDDRNVIGTNYDWREKASATSSDVSEMTVFLSHQIDKKWKGQVYLLKGFSDGSPEWGVGAFAAYAF